MLFYQKNGGENIFGVIALFFGAIAFFTLH